MKVIGHANKDDIIVMMTRSELANIVGEYSEFGLSDSSIFKVGSTVDVSSLYKKLHTLQSADHIEKAIASLEALMSGLRRVNSNVKPELNKLKKKVGK